MTEYLNAPVVVELYGHHEFEEHNIKLRFVDEYRGIKITILERMVKEDKRFAAGEIQG